MPRHSVRPMGQNRRTRRAAFTLIEVLVVVAIIALLMGILMPSLSKARHLSKASVCLAHMRQLGIGAVMYSQEFSGYVPPVDPAQKDVGPQDSQSGPWGHYDVGSDDMRVYYGSSAESKVHKYGSTLDLWKCPGAGNVVLEWADLAYTYTDDPDASRNPTGVRRGSAYEYNPWMYNVVVAPAGSWPPMNLSGKPAFRMLRTSFVKFPGRVMITQDNDNTGLNWYPDGKDPHAPLDGGNMFYMDGHAGFVRAKSWCKETDSGRTIVRR